MLSFKPCLKHDESPYFRKYCIIYSIAEIAIKNKNMKMRNNIL